MVAPQGLQPVTTWLQWTESRKSRRWEAVNAAQCGLIWVGQSTSRRGLFLGRWQDSLCTCWCGGSSIVAVAARDSRSLCGWTIVLPGRVCEWGKAKFIFLACKMLHWLDITFHDTCVFSVMSRTEAIWAGHLSSDQVTPDPDLHWTLQPFLLVPGLNPTSAAPVSSPTSNPFYSKSQIKNRLIRLWHPWSCLNISISRSFNCARHTMLLFFHWFF